MDKKMHKDRVIVILGPTATGKSALAVQLAKKINGEIISADSRQVYKWLDIGTGKITKKEMKGVPHHLLDVANPKRKFTVTKYKLLADKKIKEIISRGKTPIIVGGTGFYIDAVTKGIVFPEVKPNLSLRKKLVRNSAIANFLTLQKLDPKRAKTIDKHNNFRIIRAIEIAKALGKVPKLTGGTPPYKVIKIGLILPLPALQKKIEKRVKQMFEDGLLKEIKKLKNFGLSDKRLRELGFEYDNPTVESVVRGSVQYAKRQMTWFKRDRDITWYEPHPLAFSKILVKVKSGLHPR